MSKASKIILLCHIVRNLVDDESGLEDLRNAMKQIGALEPLEGCRDILNEQPQPSRKRKRLGQMCALCRVTESPEWRKGPEGKRNLCNSASSVLPDVTTTHCMQKENSESRVGVCEQTPNGYPEWEIKNVGISAVDFAAYSSTSDAQVSLVRQIIPLGSPSSLHWTDFTCDFSIDWQFYSQAGEPLSPITNTLAALRKGAAYVSV
ncbi:hypothetical protein E8E15_001122 [Penicillium rubens]|nr:hypothetical protein E8E15_001122 [Penicillium rubens]